MLSGLCADIIDIAKNILTVSIPSTFLWPGFVLSAELAVGNKASLTQVVQKGGGYMPWGGVLSGKSPLPWQSVCILSTGNTALHEVGSRLTDKVLLVSLGAALGSAPGSIQVAGQAVGRSGSFYVLIRHMHSPRLALLGIMYEWAREALYNVYCLNIKKNLKQYRLSQEQELAAATGISTFTGALTGTPNSLGSRCYAAALDLSKRVLPKPAEWRRLLLSLPVRGATIGSIFFIINLSDYAITRYQQWSRVSVLAKRPTADRAVGASPPDKDERNTPWV